MPFTLLLVALWKRISLNFPKRFPSLCSGFSHPRGYWRLMSRRLKKRKNLCRLCVTFNEYVTFVEETIWTTKSVWALQTEKAINKVPYFLSHSSPASPPAEVKYFQQVNLKQKKRGEEKKRTTSGRWSKINTFTTSYHWISMFLFQMEFFALLFEQHVSTRQG